MKFKELLDKYEDNDIIDEIVIVYPAEVEVMDGYRSALDELRNTEVIEDKFTIFIDKVKEDEDGFRLDVSGLYEGDDEVYSLSLTDWGKWLSMNVDQEAIETYGELNVLARCMWELCWHGFTNQEHAKVVEELHKRMEEIDNGTAVLIPADEVMENARKMLEEKRAEREAKENKE